MTAHEFSHSVVGGPRARPRCTTCDDWLGHSGDCAPTERRLGERIEALVDPEIVRLRTRVDALTAELAAERAENARLRKSLTFFAARFLAVAPRHGGSGEAT